MSNFKLENLWTYPVKSMRPIEFIVFENDSSSAIKFSDFFQDGYLISDRRWMLVDLDGKFITQRELSELTFFQPFFDLTQRGSHSLYIQSKTRPDGSLGILDSRTGDSVLVNSNQSRKIDVNIWARNYKAYDQGDEVSQWLSVRLKKEVRLVESIQSTDRFVDSKTFLVIFKESIDDLSQKCGKTMDPLRFRPNMFLSGGEAYLEDRLDEFELSGVKFKRIKNCARCSITLINPQDGKRGAEPLKSLAKYRRNENKVEFGAYYERDINTLFK